MPRRCVTIRDTSTAALPIRSIADTTCSTLDICSASRLERAASTHTSRISWTSSVSRSSSSLTSSAMRVSAKNSDA